MGYCILTENVYLYIHKHGDRLSEQTESMITENEYLEMKEFNKEFEDGGVLGTNEIFKTYFNNLYKIQEYEKDKRERVLTEH